MTADDNRRMSTTSPIEGQVRLADWGVIRAQGADAASFLHGQLTQDVEHLESATARLAGYCSAKGRLLASFVVWREDAQSLLLACSADLLAATLKRLAMFVLRAKCKLSDASAELALYGLAGPAAQAWLAERAPSQDWAVAPVDGARVIRLPAAEHAPRFLLVQPAASPAPALPALSADDWRWLETRSGVVRIAASTADQFVPQMVNFDLVGGLNFHKGCYPGQEVVARSQYRGTLKRRTAMVDADAELAPGQEVFHLADPGQPAGMVALAGKRAGDGWSALVEVKIAALDGGEIRAGSADGPLLRLAALPYALPSDQP